ncbi:MAG: diaminopimelate epimerase [Bacteroidota bacterium]
MKIHFTKMSGAGNDFVVVDNRSGIISDPHSFSNTVCNRRLGIGADGVLLLERSDISGFTMKYYNADGSNAGMCGNGGRCIAKFAYDNSVVTSDNFSFEAFGHIYESTRIDSTLFDLKMKNPFDVKLNQEISLDSTTVKANYINTGTDHSVIFLDDNSQLGTLESADIFGIGKKIRYHNIYQPKGTNVNFVSKLTDNIIQIRTYERGVEDETLACGTGSVASAILSSMKYQMKSPIRVKVLSGEFLEISFQKTINNFFDVRLKGSAKVTFYGEIDI